MNAFINLKALVKRAKWVFLVHTFASSEGIKAKVCRWLNGAKLRDEREFFYQIAVTGMSIFKICVFNS